MADHAKPRGFAALSPERRAEISRLGGQKSQSIGVAHRFNSETGSKAGQRGGAVTSANAEHMAAIGRRGAESRAAKKAK